MMEQTDFVKELSQINFVEIFLILFATWISFKGVKWGIPWLAEQSPSRFRGGTKTVERFGNV